MKKLANAHDLADLAKAFAEVAADVLECDVSEIDLELEAPEPLEPAKIRLAYELVGAGSSTSTDEKPADETTTDEAAAERPERKSAPAPRSPRSSTREQGSDDGRRRDADATPEELDEEAEAAADFVEGLLDALDLPGDLKVDIANGTIHIEVVELGTGALIGRRGQTLESIQEMMRASLQRQFQRRSRVILDIEGYRERRLEKFLERAEEAISEVLDTGESVRLEPMDVYERKQVHQLVADVDGLQSRSHGREPSRRVVIEPADD